MDSPEFENLVDRFYQPLFRFALSLTRREAEASDLTQQTFFRWATRGHQLRDRSKAKTWLFTTLHREFLAQARRGGRFVGTEISELEHEIPAVQAGVVDAMDARTVLDSLLAVEEMFRAPLMLFYMEGHSYKEIAEVLDIPIGTVMSRLSRGKQELKRRLESGTGRETAKVVPFVDEERKRHGNA